MNGPKLKAPIALLANLVLTGGAVGCALVGAHVYSSRHAYPPPVVLVTLVAAALAMAGLGFGVVSAIERKLKVLLALFSTVTALYVAELGWSLFSRSPEKEEVARSLGVEFDGRTQLEVVRDLGSEGVEAYPLVSPVELLPNGAFARNGEPLLPLSGISLVTTVWCNESGRYLIYPSDQHGFNNPREAWEEAPRVVLIGDSFVQGACAEAGSDVGSQLRKKGHSVLNLGMGGGGPLLELAILREYAEVRQPRFVLWSYYEGNDLLDLRSEMESSILRRYLERPGFSQGLLDRQGELDAVLTDYLERRLERSSTSRSVSAVRERATLFFKLTRLRERLSMVRTRIPAGAFDTLAEILSAAKERISERGGELLFVYLPAYSRYASESAENHHRDRVLSLVRALPIPVVDFHQTLSRSGDPTDAFPLGLSGHYDGDGYRWLAEEMDRAVSARSDDRAGVALERGDQEDASVDPAARAAGLRQIPERQ